MITGNVVWNKVVHECYLVPINKIHMDSSSCITISYMMVAGPVVARSSWIVEASLLHLVIETSEDVEY